VNQRQPDGRRALRQLANVGLCADVVDVTQACVSVAMLPEVAQDRRRQAVVAERYALPGSASGDGQFTQGYAGRLRWSRVGNGETSHASPCPRQAAKRRHRLRAGLTNEKSELTAEPRLRANSEAHRNIVPLWHLRKFTGKTELGVVVSTTMPNSIRPTSFGPR
jgi:hypothetical protein